MAIWATQAATVAAAAGKKMGVRPAAGSLSLEQPVLALDACAGPADVSWAWVGMGMDGVHVHGRVVSMARELSITDA